MSHSTKCWGRQTLTEKNHYVNKRVKIFTADHKVFCGWVYTIDPVTCSVVLYDNGQVTTIFGHALSEVKTTNDESEQAPNLEMIFQSKSKVLHPEELQLRKQGLKNWLEKNRLPVEIYNDRICVANAVEILPPYNKNSCVATNQVILTRIQNLLNSMPDM